MIRRQWEYKLEVAPDDHDDSVIALNWLNQQGLDGWELLFINRSASHMLFKRQIVDCRSPVAT